MPVTLLSWRPTARGLLRGFATVQLGKSLKITDVPVLYSNGKLWASLPGKLLIANGKALLDDLSKQQYVPILEWADKQAGDRFSAAVVAAIRAAHGPYTLKPSA